MFRKQIQIIPPVSFRLALPFVVVAHLLCTPALLAQSYEWKVIARPAPGSLEAVDFVDSAHGFIGSSGTFPPYFFTTDGGNTWTQCTSGSTYVPRSISMVDRHYGWVASYYISAGSASSAKIARTTDGGQNWVVQRDRDDQVFSGTASQSYLRNTTVGSTWHVGAQDTAIILRTTDAGATWEERRMGADLQLGKVAFVDSLHGWITPDRWWYKSWILRTTDGGENWTQLATPQPFDAFAFLDVSRGWASGGLTGTSFFRTVDGGSTWDYLFSVPYPGDDFYAYALSFTDTLYGWAFGGAVDQGISTEGIYRTTNGGASWYRESVGLTADFGQINDGLMLDRSHGFAVAEDGRVLGYQKVPVYVKDPTEHKPLQMQLLQNYPEPFNGITTIEYHIERQGPVRLEILDILGREIATIINEVQAPGIYSIRFDAGELSSGPYIYRLVSNSSTIIRKMLMLK